MIAAAAIPAGVVIVDDRLDPPPARVAQLEATLSWAERARAARAAGPDARRRAVVSRGLLREIVGRATAAPPAAVELRREPGGRPYVPGHAVRVSVAHCGERILVAVCADRDVGIDIERHRSVMDAAAVAQRVLPPEEAGRVVALPEPARSAAIIDAWTRREARFKAMGDRRGQVAVRAIDAGPGWSAALAVAYGEPARLPSSSSA